MAAPAFEFFKVYDPQQKQGSGIAGLSYWVYHVRAKTTLANYNDKDMTRTRRFRDFDWFRTQLCMEYPWCIVPPIPQKTMAGTMEKVVAGSHDKQLLEYRCRALRKFLSRVGAHPHLYNSSLLKDFLEMDDVEWERRTKTPSKMAGPDTGAKSFMSSVSESAGQWRPGGGAATAGGGVGNGSDLKGSFSKDNSATNLVGSLAWDECKMYAGQLDTSLAMLKDRLDQLVKRRRDTSHGLLEFGKAFCRVGELEALMEQDGGTTSGTTEGGLGNAIVSVGKHSEFLCNTYVEHGEDETKKVVETLVYYQGICDGVKDALKRLTSCISERDNFIHKVKSSENNLQKVTQVTDPQKRATQEAELTAKRDDLIAKRDALIKHVINFEILFKEELRRFHREKQYDMKSMLKTFVELQVDYSNKMNTSWESLLPNIQAVIDVQLGQH